MKKKYKTHRYFRKRLFSRPKVTINAEYAQRIQSLIQNLIERKELSGRWGRCESNNTLKCDAWDSLLDTFEIYDFVGSYIRQRALSRNGDSYIIGEGVYDLKEDPNLRANV